MPNTSPAGHRPPVRRRLGRTLLFVLTLFVLPPGCMVAAHYGGDGAGHSRARYGSIGLAPDAATSDAVIQVYAARAARWRGAIGVHTWIATKRSDERAYTRLEVIGYRVYWGGGAVRVRRGTPDAVWFGNPPTLLREIRGDARVDALIERLHAAAASYPHDDRYRVWPGPNSNTFVAHLARQVPELRLELPANAVGKDWLVDGRVAALTPSGTGAQLSLGGYAGVLVGLEEGVEVNLLGLSAGIDLLPPALKLPGIGRIGFPDLRRREIRTPPAPAPAPPAVPSPGTSSTEPAPERAADASPVETVAAAPG